MHCGPLLQDIPHEWMVGPVCHWCVCDAHHHTCWDCVRISGCSGKAHSRQEQTSHAGVRACTLRLGHSLRNTAHDHLFQFKVHVQLMRTAKHTPTKVQADMVRLQSNQRTEQCSKRNTADCAEVVLAKDAAHGMYLFRTYPCKACCLSKFFTRDSRCSEPLLAAQCVEISTR